VLAMFEWINGGFGPAIRIALVVACVSQPIALPAETVAVRYREGVGHGFLVLRTPDGKPLADGDSTQVVRGDLVTSKMSFKFADGSVYEETTIFSQRGTFQLSLTKIPCGRPQMPSRGGAKSLGRSRPCLSLANEIRRCTRVQVSTVRTRFSKPRGEAARSLVDSGFSGSPSFVAVMQPTDLR
jgi:hypothetical protein